jgi:hypothetical protein
VTLAALQKSFYQLVTRTEPTGGALPDVLCVGTPALDAAARVAVYGDMFVWRQVDALREDFPKLVALLGDEGFYELAERYLRARPSESFSLAHLGGSLARYLKEGSQPRADLSDVAALEWARAEVFDEADGEPISGEVLRQAPPDILPTMSLRLIPALRLLELEHDVPSMWRRAEEGGPVAPPGVAPTLVGIWRKGFRVFHAPLTPRVALALQYARAGRPLAEVCEAFSSEPEPVNAALQAIGAWFAEGWVLGLIPSEVTL